MSNNLQHFTIADLLMDLERELRVLNLWESESPPAEALASKEPFAIDSLTFPQWLQFIFIPRLYFMIEQQQSLPAVSGIKPMAEHYFHALPKLYSAPLTGLIDQIDKVLSGK